MRFGRFAAFNKKETQKGGRTRVKTQVGHILIRVFPLACRDVNEEFQFALRQGAGGTKSAYPARGQCCVGR